MPSSLPDNILPDKVDDAASPPEPATASRASRQGHRRHLGVLASAAIGVAAAIVVGLVVVQQTGATESASTDAGEATGPRPVVNAKAVRGSSHYNYMPFADIEAAVEGSAIGLAGEVVGWSDGRSSTDEDEVDLNAVLEVRVTDPINVPNALKGDRVYIEVSRGGYIVDEDGEEVRNPGAPPAYRTVDQLAEAIPKGVRVIVLGGLAPNADELAAGTPGSQVLNPGAGHPAGTPLVSAHPQGLLFETHTGGVASGMDHDGPAAWGWTSDARSSSGVFESLLTQATR